MLRQGKVVNVTPKAHSVDLVMVDSGTIFNNVQVLSHAWVSTNTGHAVGLPTPTPGQTQYDIARTKKRDIYAYVDFAGSMPVVVGFKMPEVGQMTFDRPDFQIDRHSSDTYQTINAAGDIERYHPSGSYFRLAASPDHEDLTGQDYDKLWAIENNTSSAPTFHYRHANAGAQVLSALINPTGSVHVSGNGAVSLSVPDVSTTGNLRAGNGASGSFTTPLGQTVTVQDGIITNIF